MIHCDDLADSESCPPALRDFINYHRLPAVCRLPPYTTDEALARHLTYVPEAQREHVTRRVPPECFATVAGGLLTPPRPASVRVRLTMCSRLGDVGVTDDLTYNSGRSYRWRLLVTDLRDFSVSP